MTRTSSSQREPEPQRVSVDTEDGSVQTAPLKQKQVLLLIFFYWTVALMMASPRKDVSITMEETRPLLETQVCGFYC